MILNQDHEVKIGNDHLNAIEMPRLAYRVLRDYLFQKRI